MSDRYTLAYRVTEARQVMNWLKAGQSGCLIGLRGAGASNFLQFLLRKDVRQYYLGQDYPNFIFILIDLLALAEQTEAAVYELMLDRLAGHLNPDTAEKIARLRSQTPVQRAIERGLDILYQHPSQHLVLFFDEFDPIFQNLNPSLFRYLRAIRDSHKGRLSYIVVAADDLACLRDDLTEVEHFYRLVSRNVCHLGPYNDADARQMIGYLAAQRAIALNEDMTARLLELSGGHAGLLKTLVSLLWESASGQETSEVSSSQGATSEVYLKTLAGELMVQAECWKVWAGLSERDQAPLRGLVEGRPPDPPALRRLKRKGLLRDDRPTTLILSPLFTDFIRRQARPSGKEIIICRSPRRVEFGERRIETLTELEFEALYYLHERRGRVCTKDELIQYVYGQQYDRMTGGVSDAALHTLMGRLRAKIEPDCGRPRYIITVRGEGYRFVEP